MRCLCEREVDFLDFHIEIYLIGYSSQGESIVVFFKECDEIFYSIVIDGYKQKYHDKWVNRTVDLWKKEHAPKASILCWTHPHSDHSKGVMDIIKDCCDDNTILVYPSHISSPLRSVFDLNKTEQKIIDSILNVNKRKIKSRLMSTIRPIELWDEESRQLGTILLTDKFGMEEPCIVEFLTLSPNSSLLESLADRSGSNPNNLSITLLIKVKGYGFLFAADTINEHINRMDKEQLHFCRFVKIPHHGSDTSDELLNYFTSESLDNACVSLFRNKNLPNQSVIDLYTHRPVDVFATGDINKPVIAGSYGIIKYDYSFFSGEINYSICTEGQCKVYPKSR